MMSGRPNIFIRLGCRDNPSSLALAARMFRLGGADTSQVRMCLEEHFEVQHLGVGEGEDIRT